VAVLVMLNNYMHDMMTALFAVSAIAAWFMLRSDAMGKAPEALAPVVHGLFKVGIFALVWTLAGGGIRAMAYEKYEWMEAVGRAQVPALVVKHVILVSLVVAGVVVLVKARRRLRLLESPERGA